MEWRQGRLTFTEQLHWLRQAEPAADAALDQLRRQMRDLLNGLGYSGDLRAQFAAWEAHNRVPPDEVPGVLRELLDIACGWHRRALRIPGGEVGWNGRVTPVSGATLQRPLRLSGPHDRAEHRPHPDAPGTETPDGPQSPTADLTGSSWAKPATPRAPHPPMGCFRLSTRPAHPHVRRYRRQRPGTAGLDRERRRPAAGAVGPLSLGHWHGRGLAAARAGLERTGSARLATRAVTGRRRRLGGRSDAFHRRTGARRTDLVILVWRAVGDARV